MSEEIKKPILEEFVGQVVVLNIPLPNIGLVFGPLVKQNGHYGVGNLGFDAEVVKEIVKIEAPLEVNLCRAAIHIDPEKLKTP